eukprot:g18643.t1
MFFMYRRLFPISGRRQSLCCFLTLLLLLCLIYGHLDSLWPAPGLPCYVSLLSLSPLQNLAAATLLFSAWSLFLRNQLNQELEEFRQRVKKVPARSRPVSSCSLCLLLWVAVLLALPSARTARPCLEAAPYATGLALLFVQTWIMYLAYRISGQQQDDFGLKRELLGVTGCTLLLVLAWSAATLSSPPLSNQYHLHSVVFYSFLLAVLVFSYLDPLVRCA